MSNPEPFENLDNDGPLSVLIHGIAGWAALIMTAVTTGIGGAGVGFSYWTSAGALMNLIFYNLVWLPVGVLWVVTILTDDGFAAWLHQFWIIATWLGVFGLNWIGAILALIGVIVGEAGQIGYLITYLIWAAGYTVITIFLSADARSEIKTWYSESDKPDGDWIDDIEDLADDAEDEFGEDSDDLDSENWMTAF